jgi:TonB family protein
MILEPKKVQKKETKTKKETAKKIDTALAKIRALERLKDKSDEPRESEDDGILIKGNQISKGTSLSGDAREKAQSSYYDLIRESLVEHWSLPTWLTREKLSAQVLLRVDPAGRVLSLKFLKNSGNAAFDQAIQSTVRDAQPLPRPPKELFDSLSDDGVIVGFPL